MHSYKAYGIQFSSELVLPELEESDGQPDVIIKTGHVPQITEKHGAGNQYFKVSEKDFILWQKNVAGYYVKNGNEITIDPHMDINAPDIRLFLLGSVFCALLHQRGSLVLHGSSVVINGKGIILSGHSGIGKSTLAGFLQAQGYDLLTDDVSAITIDKNGIPYILSGFPSLKLWKDSAELMGSNVEALEPVMHNREKFRIEIQNFYHSVPVEFNELYVLNVHDVDNIDVKPVLGFTKLETLIKNTYRYRYVTEQGLTALHFKQCAGVAEHITMYQIYRPKNGFMIKELAESVKQNVMQ